MADSFIFVESEDEGVPRVTSHRRTSEEFRPSRMGLGYTMEMYKKKREAEKEEKRIAEKILGKRRRDDSEDDIPEKAVPINTDDEEESRGGVIKKKDLKPALSMPVEPQLSKSQKKRLRLKNRNVT